MKGEGYQLETHKCRTSDGYVLTLFRIPQGSSGLLQTRWISPRLFPLFLCPVDTSVCHWFHWFQQSEHYGWPGPTGTTQEVVLLGQPLLRASCVFTCSAGPSNLSRASRRGISGKNKSYDKGPSADFLSLRGVQSPSKHLVHVCRVFGTCYVGSFLEGPGVSKEERRRRVADRKREGHDGVG